ncbi:MAG: 4-hydroxy-tetrahydrodipicolinate synthase [Chitinophagaceae bacterium]|nr:4-hydroxy-tetrahydrodipicolinate synthase [Chitinophagaceae bacterium]
MSLREKFRGTGIAVVTPFHADGKIDWDSYRKLISFWIDNKVEYLVVLGTTGESATIHGVEKQEILSFVKEVSAERVPLMAGIGGNDTAEVISNFKTFDLSGYDAILSVSPYYSRPNQEGLFQHYKALDQATPLPLMLYNVPSRTGQTVTATTQLLIAGECKNIFGTKEASGNFDLIMELLKYKPVDFLVVSGDDALTLPMMSLGAEGVISVVANAYPKDFSDMVRLCLAGKFAEAQALHYRYTEIIASLFAEGSPSGVKAYLSEMGLCGHHVRMPVWPVSEQHQKKIKELMKGVA